jgi:hypothetical protein
MAKDFHYMVDCNLDLFIKADHFFDPRHGHNVFRIDKELWWDYYMNDLLDSFDKLKTAMSDLRMVALW